jgi:hypothetical protein
LPSAALPAASVADGVDAALPLVAAAPASRRHPVTVTLLALAVGDVADEADEGNDRAAAWCQRVGGMWKCGFDSDYVAFWEGTIVTAALTAHGRA